MHNPTDNGANEAAATFRSESLLSHDGATLKSARKARENISRFMLNYRFATDQLLTKIQILKTEFEHLHDYSPIEHVSSRVKTVESILEKARRRQIPLEQHELQAQMHDIAGVRVVCSFIDDVYRVCAMLTAHDDIVVVEIKDYIATPKTNGYRSLHLIVQVPVFLSTSTEKVLVEIQLRTVAMDFWASLEHKIDYKYGTTIPSDLTAELTRAAAHTSDLDETMQRIHNRTILESPKHRHDPHARTAAADLMARFSKKDQTKTRHSSPP